MEELFLHKFPPQFVRNIRKYVKNVTSNEIEICKKSIQFRAEVTFQLATNTMSVTVISRRLSFFDKLSGFGINRKLQKLFYLKIFPFQVEFWDFLLGSVFSAWWKLLFGFSEALSNPYSLIIRDKDRGRDPNHKCFLYFFILLIFCTKHYAPRIFDLLNIKFSTILGINLTLNSHVYY